MFAPSTSLFGNTFVPRHTRQSEYDYYNYPRQTRQYSENEYDDYPAYYNPFNRQHNRRHNAELLKIREQREKEEMRRQQKRREALIERERKLALQQQKARQVKIRRHKLLMIRANMAARTIQHAWSEYCVRKEAKLKLKQNEAALVITRAMRNFGPIAEAKSIAASLRELKEIAKKVEEVDQSTALQKKRGPGISLFEHTLDKLVARVDFIDSYGSELVRAKRKQVVIRANQRTAEIQDLNTNEVDILSEDSSQELNQESSEEQSEDNFVEMDTETTEEDSNEIGTNNIDVEMNDSEQHDLEMREDHLEDTISHNPENTTLKSKQFSKIDSLFNEVTQQIAELQDEKNSEELKHMAKKLRLALQATEL